MATSLETIIREAYAAFGRGDIDGYLSACTEDFSFNVPGQSAVAGAYVAKAGLHELGGKVMAITRGTFIEDVEDVLANDQHAVVLARHRFTRDGISRDYLTAHVYDLVNGKLARCFEQPRELIAFDEAWGAWQHATG